MNVEKTLRAGLAFLAVTQFVVGCWALFAPRSFFDIPWVGMHMQYNAHLMMDYGAMSLASSVVLGASFYTGGRLMTRTALGMYLMWSASHLVIHTRLLHHLSPEQRAPLMLALSAAVVIPLVLLYLTTRLEPPKPALER
ncbi:hypothetical protein [Streptomyces sp. NPDC005989]|uniref:hypothetical protein n=1 Tax=Streptomyces sp. NPDC005989 TaxID=3156727 RepID=UPI0033C7622D